MELTQEQYDALVASIDELKTTVKDREAKIETLEVESALKADGITDPATIRFLRYEHSQAEVAEGAERPAFTDWLKGYKEANASSPLLAKPKPVEPPKAEPKAATPPTPPNVTQTKGTPPASTKVAAPPAPPTPPVEPKDTTHANRTNTEPTALANLTPQQIANLSKEQREAFGGWKTILSQVVAPGAENSGGV